MNDYDVAVIGAGPAGLTAALYCGRYALKTIVFGEVFGGTISEAMEVANYPGFKMINGLELSQKMVEQVIDQGISVHPERVNEIKKQGNLFSIKTSDREITAKKIILAIGTKRRLLNVPGEAKLKGRGVSYCATCDGPFFKDKIVAIVGGGDAALSSAIILSNVAKKVIIIYRKPSFGRAEPYWVNAVDKTPNIEKMFNANVVEFIGEKNLTKIKLDNGKTMDVDGTFIEIGSEPQKEFLQSIGIKTNEAGYVLADTKMRTSVNGLFTAGQINAETFDQAVVAAAQGAIAANTAYEEIKSGDSKKK